MKEVVLCPARMPKFFQWFCATWRVPDGAITNDKQKPTSRNVLVKLSDKLNKIFVSDISERRLIEEGCKLRSERGRKLKRSQNTLALRIHWHWLEREKRWWPSGFVILFQTITCCDLSKRRRHKKALRQYLKSWWRNFLRVEQPTRARGQPKRKRPTKRPKLWLDSDFCDGAELLWGWDDLAESSSKKRYDEWNGNCAPREPRKNYNMF